MDISRFNWYLPDMNRREFLIASGGIVVASAGGTAVAKATRADLLAEDELTRGNGEAVAIEKQISRDSVEYLESTQEVREQGHTLPFSEWAQRKSAKIGADEVVSIVENRLDKPVEGVGSGVRYLIFGSVVTVDRTVTYDRHGSVVSEPNVSLNQLTSVAPHTMAVTVNLNGQSSTNQLPVGVGHSEVHMD